jgi:chemotaxis protein methyltransferase CheR
VSLRVNGGFMDNSNVISDYELPLLMDNSNVISDYEFSLFQEFIYQQAGISLNDRKKSLVVSRLSKRLRHFSLSSFEEYFEKIIAQNHLGEKQVAINLLTTNETYFFREKKHFTFLANHVLPEHDIARNFRVWSAASSTGEEAYSIAMLLDDKLKNFPWEIIGSDISSTVVERAKKGLYQQERIDGIPLEYLQTYCLKGKNEYAGKLLVSAQLRQRVSFFEANLTATLPDFGRFQVIFLRNVMIYFDDKTKQKILKKVVEKLVPGGYLFISHSESISNLTHSLIQVAPSIFQKK